MNGVNRAIRFVACAFFLALAPLLLVQAEANGDPPSGPVQHLNGFNLAQFARSGLRARNDNGTTTVVVDEVSLDYARRAFAREPLATDALFMLAVDERARIGANGGQRLLELSAGIDRRNRNLNALQVEQAVRQGDFAGMSRLIDRMVRVQPDMTEQFVQPLVQALADERVLPPVRDILADDPIWANAFWLAVPGDAVLTGRMYQLRRMTAHGTDAASDRRLMAALAGAGRFDDAFALRALAGAEPEGGDTTGFLPTGGTAPFGWAAQTSGERSMTPRGNAGYELFVQQGMEGELGRQLLRLAPGTYRFAANVTPVSAAGNLSVRLVCAGADNLDSGPRPLDAAASFTVSPACRNWWLVLEGSAWRARGGFRAEIADMQFRPQSRAGQ